MAEECILEYHFEPKKKYGKHQPGDNRRWRMGLTQGDHKWLTETLGVRAKRQETWDNGKGMWMYLGTTTIRSMPLSEQAYKVRVKFRSKSHAMLFKLARLGQI